MARQPEWEGKQGKAVISPMAEEMVCARLRERRRKVVPLFVVVGSVVMFVRCTPRTTQAALPAPPPEVVVDMYEYQYEFQQSVPAGRVVFRFVNEGNEVHRPVLLPLSEEVPPILEQVRGDVRAALTPFARVPPRQPGETGTFAVDLVAGQRYALICFARTGDGRSHAVLGMASDIRPKT